MKKRLLFLPAALFFCCCAAAAGRDARALAEELLQINGTRQALEATVEASLRQLGSAPDDPTRPAVERFVRKCFAFDALKGELAGLYLKNYTTDELRALIAFYRTPLGQKKAQVDARIGAALSEITNRRFSEGLPELQKELKAAASSATAK